MGNLNALALVAVLGACYWLHTTLNYQYEWVTLGFIAILVGLNYPDTKLESLLKMVKWVWK